VSAAPDRDRPRPAGLRERKKARTRASIQQQAMRLFREQGYDATTVEQIADAAEVSPSTFFRYFPTKEDVVLTDEFDPLIIEAFTGQPAELTPLQALRGAFRTVLGTLSEADMADARQRAELMVAVPQVRGAFLESMGQSMRMLAEVVAARIAGDPDDLEVRIFAGALYGAAMSVLFHWLDHPEDDVVALLDRAMAHLEAGLPLAPSRPGAGDATAVEPPMGQEARAVP
jgi:AcrR family transcriptional regulator